MDTLRIGFATQTPLVRFRQDPDAPPTDAAPTSLREALQPSDHWRPTPGGVCRLVLQSVQDWARAGWLHEGHWFSLQSTGPERVRLDDVPLVMHNLRLDASQLAAYGRTKEALWAQIHGRASAPLDVDDFRFYTRYNAFTADALLAHGRGLDLVYVHDFQLLQVGALIGPVAPAVFRWHGPFQPHIIPPYTRRFILRAIEDFDAVIVSTRRDLEGLIRAGYHGVARQVYPTIDPAHWQTPSPSDVSAYEHQVGVGADDNVVLCVARMDHMKRQDLLLDAVGMLRRTHPRLRLVLVGNGSFTSSQHGGIGLSKAADWKAHLESRVRELRIEDHVRFAHWIPDDALQAAYARADAVVLPSDVEGFGLTVLEAWRYRRPIVVSAGAGSAEIVRPGYNGEVFPAESVPELAQRLARILRGTAYAEALGEAGATTLAHMRPSEAAQQERAVLEDAVARFGDPK